MVCSLLLYVLYKTGGFPSAFGETFPTSPSCSLLPQSSHHLSSLPLGASILISVDTMVPQPTAVAFTAALAGLAAATPIKTKIGTKAGSFSVNQVANAAFKPHGAFQPAKAYNKYGIPMPEGLARTVAKYNAAKKAKRDSGSATTTPEQYDIQ